MSCKKKTVCSKCGLEISNNNYNKHFKSCDGNIKIRYKLDHTDLNCKFCGKECKNKNSLINHELWCDLNPNHRSKDIFYTESFKNANRSHTGWNKGLTKETDERVAKQAQTNRLNWELGINKRIDYHHSEEVKDKIRNKALSNKYVRKCKKTEPYTKKDGEIVMLDSSFEVRVAIILDKLCINWNRPEPINWVDSEGRVHNYFADFYLVDYDIYLDPKNEYCFNVQKDKINYINSHYTNVYFMHEEDITESYILSLIK